MKTIRICSESGNVESIMKQFNDVLVNFPGINFKTATIKQNLSQIPNDKNNPDFYPLVLTSKDFRILVSEVRCGYHGCSTDAMIQILKLTGFNPSQKTIDKIYNTPNINITLYKENPIWVRLITYTY